MLRKTLMAVAVCLGAMLPASAQSLNTRAPDFTGQTPSGDVVQLSDFEGEVILLDFWASWCGPCRKEMPFLIELYEENQDASFEIIAVNIDTDQENMDDFLESLDVAVPFTMLADREAAIPPLYELDAMPTSVFIDAQGMIRYRHDGFRDKDRDQYRAELQTLLSE